MLVELDWVCRALHLRNLRVFDSGERRLFLNVHPLRLAADPDAAATSPSSRVSTAWLPSGSSSSCLETEGPADDQLAAAVAAHRRYGFSIAMDQFGQGRSNLRPARDAAPEDRQGRSRGAVARAGRHEAAGACPR
jgi:EAL domain-containing protein (putative c-di-GMP-specific phosphodiesterase class I)